MISKRLILPIQTMRSHDMEQFTCAVNIFLQVIWRASDTAVLVHTGCSAFPVMCDCMCTAGAHVSDTERSGNEAVTVIPSSLAKISARKRETAQIGS